MIVLRNKVFSDNEKRKDRQFKREMREIDKGRYNKVVDSVVPLSNNLLRGNIIDSTLGGAVYGAVSGVAQSGLVNGTLAAIGASKALKKGLPVGRYTKKYINAFNKRKGNNLINDVKEQARNNAITYGILSAGSKIGRSVSDKYDDFVERITDVSEVRSGKMSKEDFVKKHYGKEYLKKLKEDDNTEK